MTTLATLAGAIYLYLLLGVVLSLSSYLGLRAFRRALECLAPAQRADLYAAAILAPPAIVALLVVVSFGRPEGFQEWSRSNQPFWFDHADPHGLCLLFVGLAVALTLIILTVAIRRVVGVLVATVRLNRRLAQELQAPSEKLLRAARRVAEPDEVGVPLGETDGTQPVSLVFGIRRPRCLFTRPLVETATGEELAGVVAHELGHVRRRDNLQKLALRLAAALQWMFPWVASLIAQWQLEVELACDDRAVSLTGTPRSVATALMKVAVPPEAPSRWSLAAGALSGFHEGGEAAVRIRVERLMHRCDLRGSNTASAPSSAPTWTSRGGLVGAWGAALLVGAALSQRLLAPSIAWLTEYVVRHCH